MYDILFITLQPSVRSHFTRLRKSEKFQWWIMDANYMISLANPQWGKEKKTPTDGGLALSSLRRGEIAMLRIESLQNERVKRWRKLQTRKGREREQAFLIEGEHLIEEALLTNELVRKLIVTDGTAVPAHWDLTNIPIVYITKTVLQAVSETETPQGLLALCQMREPHMSIVENGKYLLVDSVQDPGNVGTLIRTAESAGLDAVFLGRGCADLYNSKTIRATQGALFHLPIVQTDLSKLIQQLQSAQIPIYGTALEGALDYRTIPKTDAFALLVGNEGSGVAEELLALCDENLYVPIFGQSESLNVAVATGILLYAFRQ